MNQQHVAAAYIAIEPPTLSSQLPHIVSVILPFSGSFELFYPLGHLLLF